MDGHCDMARWVRLNYDENQSLKEEIELSKNERLILMDLNTSLTNKVLELEEALNTLIGRLE